MELEIVALNFLYALLGTCLALCSMWLGYKWFDNLTSFNIDDELKAGNKAVGNVLAGLCIGIGLTVGLCVGLSLN